MELKVYQQNGTESGQTVTLDSSVFGIEPNDHVLWLDVRRIQAAARQGTHKTKERSETAGSTRKLYRQKGTGHARMGDAKSPLRKSGGTFFGPKPHKYTVRVNRKAQKLARRSALSYKAQGEAIRVVTGVSFDAPSTRDLKSLLEAHGLAGQKVLLLTGDYDTNLYRSSTNLPKVSVRKASDASTVDLLDAGVIVMLDGAADALTAALGSPAPAEQPA